MLSTPTPARPRMRSRRARARNSAVTVVEVRVTMASYSPNRSWSASRSSVLETWSTWNPRSARYAMPSGAMVSMTSAFMSGRRDPVAAQEAQEVPSLREAPLHPLPVADDFGGEREHLARAEVEAAVELIHRAEDLRPREVRVADHAHQHPRAVHQLRGLEPAVALRLLVEGGARVGRGERDLDGVAVDLGREADGLRDGLARLAGQPEDEGAVDRDAERLRVPGEPPRHVEPHPLLHVVQDRLVARLLADQQEAEPVVLEDLERRVGHIGLGVHRPGDAEAPEAARDRLGARQVVGEGVVV